MSDTSLKSWLDRGGALLRLRLNMPKANITDAAMLEAIGAALSEHAPDADIKAVLLDHEGPHFSFGASVPEHLPGKFGDMLSVMNKTLLAMLQHPVPILVAVKGQCLGGGLEVACGGNRIFAAPDASFGQPEIKVGVFAPYASFFLTELIGQIHAEDMLYSGRSVSGEEASAMGLVAELSDNPEAAALTYFDEHLASVSASVLRFAVQAAREDYADRFAVRMAKLEELYTSGLMETKDAVEGLEAFMAKRPAQWKNC
ncbi:MAG: cyclohexa-1,5-dienecarbonyl-CoA hydratase [Rhodospirillales bacterium]|jgi:cyclohexa-1,5-dienecarbonyl-CoA hydratase|nr:cyclohexa-1,5-dienecarbonyl-CoA hydratase [Rhodospirillales bacterium]